MHHTKFCAAALTLALGACTSEAGDGLDGDLEMLVEDEDFGDIDELAADDEDPGPREATGVGYSGKLSGRARGMCESGLRAMTISLFVDSEGAVVGRVYDMAVPSQPGEAYGFMDEAGNIEFSEDGIAGQCDYVGVYDGATDNLLGSWSCVGCTGMFAG